MVVAAFLIVLASVVLWVFAADRIVRGHPIIASQPRRYVPWSLVDLSLVGLMFIIVMSASTNWNRKRLQLPEGEWRLHELQPVQQIALLKSFAVVALVSLAFAILICRVRARATWSDLGWNKNTIRSDLKLGLVGFGMLIVPMLLIHALAQMVFGSEESHPFIELILKDPRIEFLWPIGVASVVVAPLTEEFFFRVLLQGWLERVSFRLEDTDHSGAVNGPSPEGTDNLDRTSEPQRNADVSTPPRHADALEASRQAGPSEPLNPWRAPTADSSSQQRQHAVGQQSGGIPITFAGRTWPIILSSLAFALAHIGQGPAPISLFVLAIGLGYVYRQTHRILPCVTIHVLVNLTAMIQLWVLVLTSQ